MNVADFFGAAAAVLASVGGGALIVWSFSNWLGKVWAGRLLETMRAEFDQNLEAYKVRLKKSEFLFQKEFEAASELVALFRRFEPRPNCPDPEWNDAKEDIARSFSDIEVATDRFLTKHGAAMTDEARTKLAESCFIAGQNKFTSGDAETSPDDAAVEGAERWYELMKEVEALLIERVRSQTDL